MKSKPRIFIGPHEIAGQYANLSKGFKRLGINYDFIPYYSHNFSYGQETKIPYLISKARIIREIRHGNKRNIFLNYLLLFIQYFLTNLFDHLSLIMLMEVINF